MILDPPEIASRRAARHAREYARRYMLNVYQIEGENVTLADIEKRTGLRQTAVRKKLVKLSKQEGPVTWAKLTRQKQRGR